ncbi:MAG: enoyl-CoA hydratase/isomerase family protein [Chloroflexi bacterium]|nr:enoyl-CoA hydratase/isomerase family protein [Chloroflexota bacterium]
MSASQSKIQNPKSKILSLVDLGPGLVQLVIDRPDDRVNAINVAFLEELSQAVADLRARPDVRGVILSSGKPDQFIAGADLEALLETPGPAEAEAAIRAFQAVLNDLESLPCTTVAAIGGAALGGGFEVALACDYRVAADSPSVSVGLPEVQLGLLPAGGGCQRLPRLVGLVRALDLVLGARRLSARRALRAGLVDEVVHPAALLEAAVQWAEGRRQKAESRRRTGLLPSAFCLLLSATEATPLGRQIIYRRARERVERETRGHYPAPLAALEAIATGRERGMAAGLEAEAHAFGQLIHGQTAQNLIALFLATQRQRRVAVVEESGGTGGG